MFVLTIGQYGDDMIIIIIVGLFSRSDITIYDNEGDADHNGDIDDDDDDDNYHRKTS
jgi:hypothetical protein